MTNHHTRHSLHNAHDHALPPPTKKLVIVTVTLTLPPARYARPLYRDEKLRNSLVVRAYNRRQRANTVEQQLLSLATKGGAGSASDGVGDLRLDVGGVRAALGLDAKSNVWFDERLQQHFALVGGIPTSVTVDELCHFITRHDNEPYQAQKVHAPVENGTARGVEATDQESAPARNTSRRPSNFKVSLENTTSAQGLHEQVIT